MVKKGLRVIGFVLCLTMLLATTGIASAENISASSLPQPTITPLTGNPTYTTKLMPIKDMPGVTALDSGKFVPVGYESGEKQFEGPGLQISNFSGGSATLCFPMEGTGSGWGGQVGLWDGSKWELLATTISPAGDEIPYSWACTAIYGSGTFAMLKWITDIDLLSLSKPSCDFELVGFWPWGKDSVDYGDYYTVSVREFLILLADPSIDLTGQTVTITMRARPGGGLLMDTPFTGTLSSLGGGFFTGTLSTPVEITVYKNISYFSAYLDFGSCKKDFIVP